FRRRRHDGNDPQDHDRQCRQSMARPHHPGCRETALRRHVTMSDAYRDRLDIIELFNRYAAALDDRTWDQLRQFYTPDATAEQPQGSPLLVGPEAIVGMISAAIDWLGPTLHLLSNYIVTVDGDRAEASCYVRGYHAGRGEHADKFQETLGRL